MPVSSQDSHSEEVCWASLRRKRASRQAKSRLRLPCSTAISMLVAICSSRARSSSVRSCIGRVLGEGRQDGRWLAVV
jgi:hypothetical protein